MLTQEERAAPERQAHQIPAAVSQALEDELEIARDLVRQHRPISPEEIAYFGLAAR